MFLPTTKNTIPKEVVFSGQQCTLWAVEWDIWIRLYEWAMFGWIVRRDLQLTWPFHFLFWWSFTPFLHFYIFCDSEIIMTPNHTFISSVQHTCWLFCFEWWHRQHTNSQGKPALSGQNCVSYLLTAAWGTQRPRWYLKKNTQSLISL